MNFDIVKKEIGARIKKLRQEKNEAQDALAEAVGLSQNSISKIERGEVTLVLENQLNIAEYFHVSLDYLICGKDNSAVLNVLTQYISLEFSYINGNTDSTISPILQIDSALFDYLMSYAYIQSLPDIPNDIKDQWISKITDTFYLQVKNNMARTRLSIPIDKNVSYPDDYDKEWTLLKFFQSLQKKWS